MRKMSAADIRYLLTVKSLHDEKKPIRNIHISRLLSVKTPTAFSKMRVFLQNGWVLQLSDNRFVLTPDGLQIAEQYQHYYQTVERKVMSWIPDEPYRRNVIYAILAELPADTLKRLSE